MASGRKDTENTQGVIRMPQQHVNAGRGVAGYKSAEGDARVEVYETSNPFKGDVQNAKVVGSDQPDSGAEKVQKLPSRKDLDEEATTLGLNPAEYANKEEVAAAIAAKKAEGSGDNS